MGNVHVNSHMTKIENVGLPTSKLTLQKPSTKTSKSDHFKDCLCQQQLRLLKRTVQKGKPVHDDTYCTKDTCHVFQLHDNSKCSRRRLPQCRQKYGTALNDPFEVLRLPNHMRSKIKKRYLIVQIGVDTAAIQKASIAKKWNAEFSKIECR